MSITIVVPFMEPLIKFYWLFNEFLIGFWYAHQILTFGHN